MRVGFFDYTPLIYAVTDNSFLLYYIYIYIYIVKLFIYFLFIYLFNG